MILTLKQIKSVTQGAVCVDENENGFNFHRFNEKEENYYISTTYEKKSRSSAGIQMVFKTDADGLLLSASVLEASTRKFFSFDVFENDKLTAEFKNFSHEEMVLPYVENICPFGNFEWKCSFEKGEKTVRIVFPFSVYPVISEIELVNATYIEPVKRSKTMLMYGDSITHGYDSLNPSRAYAVQLAHMLDAEAFNKAIGGERFCPGLGAIKNDISPDYITVAYGTNDWSTLSQEELYSNCSGFYKNLKKNYPEAKIFAITPIWRANCDEEKKFLFSGVYETICKVCEEIGGITVIDGINFVPHDTKLFADLRLHPTNEGFDHYVQNLYTEIKKFI